MSTVWQYLRQWTTGTGTGPANCEAPYDEDLVGCERASGWWCLASQRQFLRLRRVAVYLLLVDLMLVWLLLYSLDPLITLLRRNEDLFGARVALSRTDTPGGGRHSDRHNIPRILHQTCANETIPHKWVDSQQRCKEVHSDFEYKVCSLEDGFSPTQLGSIAHLPVSNVANYSSSGLMPRLATLSLLNTPGS